MTASGTPNLTLTSADLAALADGGDGQRQPLEKVYAGQLAKHKLLICAVVRFGGRAVPTAAATLREHYDLLAAAERSAPDAVAAILSYPHVGAWAAQSVRRLSRDPGSAAGLDYLGAIAASAAIRAGYACSVSLRLADGALMLPALGRAVLPGTHATVTVSGPAEATITAGGQVITIPPDPDADIPGWQAARVLAMGDRSLLLDDLDPHRSYEPYPLPGRLGDRDVAHWQRALDEAWRLLASTIRGTRRRCAAGCGRWSLSGSEPTTGTCRPPRATPSARWPRRSHPTARPSRSRSCTSSSTRSYAPSTTSNRSSAARPGSCSTRRGVPIRGRPARCCTGSSRTWPSRISGGSTVRWPRARTPARPRGVRPVAAADAPRGQPAGRARCADGRRAPAAVAGDGPADRLARGAGARAGPEAGGGNRGGSPELLAAAQPRTRAR